MRSTRFALSVPSAFLLVSVIGFVPLASAADPGFVPLFNGKDFTGWKVPVGDNGHWKVVDGVIDYDAESEAQGDKNLWTEREFGDFVLHVDWRIKETPYVNPNVPIILPDGTHKKGAGRQGDHDSRCPTPTRASSSAAAPSPR